MNFKTFYLFFFLFKIIIATCLPHTTKFNREQNYYAVVLSDKESKSLLVWSHKIEIVKAKNFRCSWITTFCEFLRLNLVFDFKLLKWSKLWRETILLAVHCLWFTFRWRTSQLSICNETFFFSFLSESLFMQVACSLNQFETWVPSN